MLACKSLPAFREVLMDKAISTKEMKEKVDGKHATVVETLAPERFRGALPRSPYPWSAQYPAGEDQRTRSTVVTQQGR
jgi:hypothetical protein